MTIINSSCDYFICYCENDMHSDSIYGEFANKLYDKLVSCNKKVYFAPRNGYKDAYINTNSLTKLIEGITSSFIVFLSPNFFNDFDYKNKEGSVVQKELAIALKTASKRANSNDFLKFVHISGFKWNNPLKLFICKTFDTYKFDDYFNYSAFIYPLEANPEKNANTFVKDFLNIDLEREKSITNYKRDIDLCFHSMIAHSKQLFLREFSIQNDDICSRYWPVFFTDSARFWDILDNEGKRLELRKFESSFFIENECAISTCATCFGALQIWHWINEDKKMISNFTHDYFISCLNSAINLIIFMRDKNHAWPQTKIFNKESDNYESDIGLNQTTLSISTLLKCGFLHQSTTPEEEKLRYSYILDSINWIVKFGTINDKFAYWDIPNNQNGSTLMTAVSFDTLIKFLDKKYVNFKNIKQIDPDIIEGLESLFEKILNFFEKMQDHNGGIHPSLDNDKISFSHTAKVMNTLGTFWELTNNAAYKEKAQKIISGCFDYLIKLLEDTSSCLYNEKLQQKFEYFNIPDTEEYEICGELIVITAIVKVMCAKPSILTLETYEKYGDKATREKHTNRLFDLLNNYRKKHVQTYFDTTAAESILINGRRTATKEQFPIYILYYYRMALSELLKLNNHLKNEEKNHGH